MKILYFAWVREKVGLSGEDVSPDIPVDTVTDLVEWLKTRGDNYARAFADPALVRVAVNQDYVDPDAAVGQNDEVAFFPPVTGG